MTKGLTGHNTSFLFLCFLSLASSIECSNEYLGWGHSWNSFYSKLFFEEYLQRDKFGLGRATLPGTSLWELPKGVGPGGRLTLGWAETPRLSNSPSKAGPVPIWCGCFCCYCHRRFLGSSRRCHPTEDCPGLLKGCL